MKKILLHDFQYNIGGPRTVIDSIANSYLSRKYNFVRIVQTETCGFNLIKAIRFVFHYKKVIDLQHGDCIYVCGLQYIGFLMTLAAKLSNVKKILIVVHGSDWDVKEHTLRRCILKYFIEPMEIRLADNIATVCDNEQHVVKPLMLAKKDANVGTIYNTFPNIEEKSVSPGKLRNLLNVGNDRIIVASVGRVVERKGHQYIIEAIKRCKDAAFVFVIIGDGDYIEKYKKGCSEEINEHRLFLLGKRNDVTELLKDVDIFLFASLNENHSLALLEAVNMKCAALVTNVGGNTEIIQDKHSGIVIPPCSAEAILSGLASLKSENIRTQYAETAFNEAKMKFSEEKTLGKLEQIFDAD